MRRAAHRRADTTTHSVPFDTTLAVATTDVGGSVLGTSATRRVIMRRVERADARN